MNSIYELALLGSPSLSQAEDVKRCIAETTQLFGLRLHHEINWSVPPDEFSPDPRNTAAAAFFCTEEAHIGNVEDLLSSGIPVLPIVSSKALIEKEIPQSLKAFNAIDYGESGPIRVATVLLELLSLLPRQRRVFLSYRRDEAESVATQLYSELSARSFDVFLDTHSIAPAEIFQDRLWHQLCDSDVLMMLDTETYFDSRWTSAEYGRAQAKGIPILQVLWPSKIASRRTDTATRVKIDDSEMENGVLESDAVARICVQLEILRSKGHATRRLLMNSTIRRSIETIGGNVAGVGMHGRLMANLADGREIAIYPSLGVPTSESIHRAVKNSDSCPSVAVVYDHIGLDKDWIKHIDWLGSHIKTAQWVPASGIAWMFADWKG